MHYLVLLAVILWLAVAVVLVFLKLLRDLLVRDFFDAPSLPDVPAEQAATLAREALQQGAESPAAHPF
jgi:hypothetical protein